MNSDFRQHDKQDYQRLAALLCDVEPDATAGKIEEALGDKFGVGVKTFETLVHGLLFHVKPERSEKTGEWQHSFSVVMGHRWEPRDDVVTRAADIEDIPGHPYGDCGEDFEVDMDGQEVCFSCGEVRGLHTILIPMDVLELAPGMYGRNKAGELKASFHLESCKATEWLFESGATEFNLALTPLIRTPEQSQGDGA